jgi:hypothetical protein
MADLISIRSTIRFTNSGSRVSLLLLYRHRLKLLRLIMKMSSRVSLWFNKARIWWATYIGKTFKWSITIIVEEQIGRILLIVGKITYRSPIGRMNVLTFNALIWIRCIWLDCILIYRLFLVLRLLLLKQCRTSSTLMSRDLLYISRVCTLCA